MGLSHAEFLRMFPVFAGERLWSRAGNTLTIGEGDGNVKVTLEPETTRRLGMLSLPVTGVRFEITGLSTQDASQFMDGFDVSYRRGGG